MPYRDREKQKRYLRAWRKSRVSREPKPAGVPAKPETLSPLDLFKLQTAQDTLKLIEEQVNAVRGDDAAGAVQRARAIAYLSSVALRAIEAGDIETRLAELEERVREAVVVERRGAAYAYTATAPTPGSASHAADALVGAVN